MGEEDEGARVAIDCCLFWAGVFDCLRIENQQFLWQLEIKVTAGLFIYLILLISRVIWILPLRWLVVVNENQFHAGKFRHFLWVTVDYSVAWCLLKYI
jgi:hypothetical protein